MDLQEKMESRVHAVAMGGTETMVTLEIRDLRDLRDLRDSLVSEEESENLEKMVIKDLKDQPGLTEKKDLKGIRDHLVMTALTVAKDRPVL